MSAERLSMRMLREVLRLSLCNKLSQRAIARSCQLSTSTVHGYVVRAKLAQLKWPLPSVLDDNTALAAKVPQ